MEEILYIVVGWSLGILSPLIVKKISQKAERNNLEKIIFNDLRELKKRLAPISYMVYPKYGKLDAKIFEWLKINSGVNFSDGLEQMAREGLGENEIVVLLNERGLKENTVSYFKKMHLFATDSHLMNFGIIGDALIEKVLEIRFHVEAFNEDIDSFREHLKLTFLPGITDTNHRIASKEIENKSLEIAKKSMYIVDRINEILNSTNANSLKESSSH